MVSNSSNNQYFSFLLGHITNIVQEMPFHLDDIQCKKFNDFLQITYHSKEVKRCVDKRLVILQLIVTLEGEIINKAIQLLKSLAEIQEILYCGEELRTPQKVLRLANICHQHFMQCKDFFFGNLKSLTRRKFFGKYFHNVLAHSAISYRIFSGSCLHTENEERMFKTIKAITSNTSSHHPGHILGNLLIRLQAEENFTSIYKHKHVEYQVNDITKLGKLISEDRYNSIFTYDYIRNNSEDWQALLETRIADFLLLGPGVWWRENEFGIEFFDHDGKSSSLSSQPKLHHFRSSNFSKEEIYLKDCWQKCINDKVIIPIDILKIDDENGNVYLEKAGMITQLKELDSVYANSIEVEVEDEEVEEVEVDEFIDFVELNIINDEEIIADAEAEVVIQGNGAVHIEEDAEVGNLDTVLITNEAKNIARALGNGYSLEVKLFDKSKLALKKDIRNMEKRKRYMDELAVLQTIVLKHVSEIENKIAVWEKEFCLKNDFAVPTSIDRENSGEMKHYMDQLKYGKFMLQNAWNINF